MNAGLLEKLGAAIDFEGPRAVVTVSGEVDLATAPTLGGLLETLVDHGHTDIVLDLDALEFFDASGIRVLARVVSLLQVCHGRLALRSVPAHTQRVLDITGFAALVDILPAPGAPQARTTAQEVQRRLGAIPTATDTVDAALQLVVTLASAAVRGADGVSVSLYRHGQLVTAAASDATVLEMDRNQYETGEGPCVSAATDGHRVRVDALAIEERWPDFVPRALEDGIASILSSPLLTGDHAIGALNIYSRGEGAFGRDEQELATLFAAHITGILVEAGPDTSDEEWTVRLNAALHSRKLIAQAQGMLMARQGISAEDAAAILGRTSRSAGRTVLDQAIDLTDGWATHG